MNETSDDKKVAEEYYETRANSDGFSFKNAFLAGVKHQKSKEKALLVKFITWVRNHWAVNAMIDNKRMVDEFLQGGK
jgi:hypothetical protein